MIAGLSAARARGRKGGRKFALAKAQVRLAQADMSNRDTSVAELCRELRTKPVTLYRHVGPDGELRKHGKQVLGTWRRILPLSANDPFLPFISLTCRACTSVALMLASAGASNGASR